jgi:hypothetical protein
VEFGGLGNIRIFGNFQKEGCFLIENKVNDKKNIEYIGFGKRLSLAVLPKFCQNRSKHE